LFIATCFDPTESSSGYDWNHMCSQGIHSRASSGYDWNYMCSQGIHVHFGIPKRLTHLFQKGFLICIQL